ncbi:MAG: hypothetical protein ACYSUN_16510, partial [Planctomycetota bacterium]
MKASGWVILLLGMAVGTLALLLAARRNEGPAAARSSAHRRDAQANEGGGDSRVAEIERRMRDMQAQIRRLEAELSGLRTAVRVSFAEPSGDGSTVDSAEF